MGAHLSIFKVRKLKQGRKSESNRRQTLYESAALPSELFRQNRCIKLRCDVRRRDANVRSCGMVHGKLKTPPLLDYSRSFL